MEICRYKIGEKILPYDEAIRLIALSKLGGGVSDRGASLLPSMITTSQKTKWLDPYEEILIEVDPRFESTCDGLKCHHLAEVVEDCHKWDLEKDEKIEGQYHYRVGQVVTLTDDEMEEAERDEIQGRIDRDIDAKVDEYRMGNDVDDQG